MINATVIVTCKKAPRALNSVRLRSFCATTQTTEPSVDLIQGFETTSVNVRSRLIEVENAHTITQKLPRSLHIAIGCRISLTNKIKTELGLINSAQGSVADILLVPGTTTYASPLTSIVRRRSRLAIPTTGALCRMPFTIFNHHPVNGILPCEVEIAVLHNAIRYHRTTLRKLLKQAASSRWLATADWLADPKRSPNFLKLLARLHARKTGTRSCRLKAADMASHSRHFTSTFGGPPSGTPPPFLSQLPRCDIVIPESLVHLVISNKTYKSCLNVYSPFLHYIT